MATVVNNPGDTGGNNNQMGLIVVVLVLLVVVFLFFVYGLPALRQSAAPPQVSVPDEIDVNVDTPQGEGQ